MIKQSFTLKDIAQITGIRANRLRVWKKRYGILQPISTEGKEHRFDPGTLRYIMKISKLLDQGYQISQILELDASELDDRLASLFQHHDEAYLKQLYDDALQTLLELDPHGLQSHYHKALERVGFQATVKKLLLPLLSATGTLWEIGTIHTVHEHLLSNFIRQKLMVAVDLAEPGTSKPETILFLPDRELHDIPLLFLLYLLLEEKSNPVYLGGSVPYPDLEDYLSTRFAETAAGYLTYTGDMDTHTKRLPELVGNFPNTQFHFAVPPDFYEDFKEAINLPKFSNLALYDSYESLNKGVMQSVG